MSLVYSLTACVLGTLELADAVMIWSRGRILGPHEFDPRHFPSYPDAPPPLRADLTLLSDWVGGSKVLVAIGFFATAASGEPLLRLCAAVAYPLGLALARRRLVPALRRAAAAGELPADTPLLFGRITTLAMGLLGAGAALEARAALRDRR